jgi:hypothetical protein
VESKAIKLAKKIFTILKDEEYDDATSALKMAKIMLPTPAVRRKLKKAAEQEAEESTEGSLVPADEDIMKFSKAMGRAAQDVTQPEEVEMPTELE